MSEENTTNTTNEIINTTTNLPTNFSEEGPQHNPTTHAHLATGENPFIEEVKGELWYWDFSKQQWFCPKDDLISQLEKETEEEQEIIAKLAEKALSKEPNKKRLREDVNLFIDSDDELYVDDFPHIPKRTIEIEKQPKKKKKYEIVNTAVYFTGIPEDITKEELENFFSRGGIIKKDPISGECFIKLFKTEEGKLKGDGTCIYFRPESIKQAITLLDGAQIRLGVVVSVTEATYDTKKRRNKKKKKKNNNKGDQSPDPNANSNGDDNNNNNTTNATSANNNNYQSKTKKKTRIRYDQTKDLSWDEETRVHIILQHMFSPKEGWTDTEFVPNLKKEVKGECERFGKVESVSVFENNEEGVIAVKFEDPIAAALCLEKMNGRWFGGRRIIAEYYDGYTNYFVPESEEQKRLRAEAWSKWLEESRDDEDE